MASLREDVRHALPANVLALMDEIEAYAELAINVDINPKAIPASTVPREADFGFDPYPYWNEIERVLWAAYPWPSITLPFARRKHCLLGWLTTELVNDPEVKELVRAGVAREGLFVEAEKFRRRIGALLGNKERTVACAVRFLKIPRDQARLVYFDVRARKRTVEVIPDH